MTAHILDTWPQTASPGTVAGVNNAISALQRALSIPLRPAVSPGPGGSVSVTGDAALTMTLQQLNKEIASAIRVWQMSWVRYGYTPPAE